MWLLQKDNPTDGMHGNFKECVFQFYSKHSERENSIHHILLHVSILIVYFFYFSVILLQAPPFFQKLLKWWSLRSYLLIIITNNYEALIEMAIFRKIKIFPPYLMAGAYPGFFWNQPPRLYKKFLDTHWRDTTLVNYICFLVQLSTATFHYVQRKTFFLFHQCSSFTT